jgi:peptide/nickel transport system ATP-binding protein
VVDGEIRLNLGNKAYDVTKTPNEVLRHLRGNTVSMIFQEPMTALNPVFRIGEQINEVIALHDGEGRSEEKIRKRTVELLEMVGIANAEGVYEMYPHELSGGMRQRVVIAMALACNPRVIIADEPTTALDVTIQAEIIELLTELRQKLDMSILFICHDIALVQQFCDRLVVMYRGQIVEQGVPSEVIADPQNDYTRDLINSIL